MKHKNIKKKNQIINKLVASTLIVNLTMPNFFYVGNYFTSYAEQEVILQTGDLDKQTDATLSKNVKFDAFFTENEKKTHYKIADVNSDKVEISLKLQVQNEGYLKNAIVLCQTENEEIPLNYEIAGVNDEAKMVQKTVDNTIYLRQVNKDEEVLLNLNISPKIEQKTLADVIKQDSKIVIKGTYMDNQGKETSIQKEVKLNISWIGNYEIENEIELLKYIPMDIDEQKKIFIQYNFKTGLVEQENMLPIKQTEIEIQIPELNGIKPEKIDVIAKSTKATNNRISDKVQFTNENWSEDKEKGIIKIKQENVKAEDGKIEVGSGQDEYLITYVYPRKSI